MHANSSTKHPFTKRLTSSSGLTSIFYIAFLVAEFPANYILQKFNLGKVVALSMLIWVSN